MLAGSEDDLWTIDLHTYQWENLIAPNTGSRRRIASGLAYSPFTIRLYRFAGENLEDGTLSNELLRIDLRRPAIDYQHVTVPGTAPTPRAHPGLFYDTVRRRLVVVSGYITGWLDDVWAIKVP